MAITIGRWQPHVRFTVEIVQSVKTMADAAITADKRYVFTKDFNEVEELLKQWNAFIAPLQQEAMSRQETSTNPSPKV